MKKFNEELRGREADRWTEDLWDVLINKITFSNSREEVRRILENLISDYEKKMILKRLGVIALVKIGKTYRETSNILWLSPNTISSIRKNLLNKSQNYKNYRKFHKGSKAYSGSVRLSKSFWEESLGGMTDIWDILKNPPRPASLGVLGNSHNYENKSRQSQRRRRA